MTANNTVSTHVRTLPPYTLTLSPIPWIHAGSFSSRSMNLRSSRGLSGRSQ